MNSKIVIASDHAGYELKQFLAERLKNKNYQIIDLGTDSLDSVDYPNYAHQLASRVVEENLKGILICGSGIGMSMAVNKHKDIRGALCTSTEMAKLSREHNDANVLILGARFTKPELAWEILEIWLNTDFSGGRHEKRVQAINL
jgi:ribose 5-phosphate isomerase B